MRTPFRILYLSYDGLCDPLGQSQITPYLKGLTKKGVGIIILSFEKKENFKKNGIFRGIKHELEGEGIIWEPLKYHKRPCLGATLYDVINGYLRGVFLTARYHLTIVHARGYIAAFIAMLIKFFNPIKLIFDMRGFWGEERIDSGIWNDDSLGYKITKYLEARMLEAADRVIVLTESGRNFLAGHYYGFPMWKIDVIPTCVDTERFTPLLGEKRDFLRDKIVVLYSGSVGTFYGFREAVEFFGLLHKREVHSFFVVLVNKHKKFAENMLKNAGIPESVYIILSLPYPEVNEWLKEADISLMFYLRQDSRAGCCPTKFGESLACGVPVVVNTSIGDCDDIIIKKGVGVILGGFSEKEYNKAIKQVLSLGKHRNIMRNECRRVAEEMFSLGMGVDRYLKIYNALI